MKRSHYDRYLQFKAYDFMVAYRLALPWTAFSDSVLDINHQRLSYSNSFYTNMVDHTRSQLMLCIPDAPCVVLNSYSYCIYNNDDGNSAIKSNKPDCSSECYFYP